MVPGRVLGDDAALTIPRTFDDVRRNLPTATGFSARRRAGVAVCLRERDGLEVLLMRRTARPGDAWGGHVSCPGGWAHAGEDVLDAARRETLEEVGLTLHEPLGQLTDRPGRPWRWLVPFSVSPFVFAVDGDPPLRPESSEVVSARWVPLAPLLDLRAADRFVFWWRPVRRIPLSIPSLMAKVWIDDFDVWGMTLDLLQDLGGP